MRHPAFFISQNISILFATARQVRYTLKQRVMNIRPITEWTLYRLRFIIAYSLLALLAVGLLVLYCTAIPPGLGPSEQQSIVTSSHISFTKLPAEIIDLPYHALQKISVQWLGVSPLGVRLPSLIFGAITALCTSLLLRRWFTTNVAIAASVIFVTSSWFLSTARLGSPIIMVPFWTSLLLLTATYVSQQTKNWRWWRVLFSMAAAVSIYTPYMAYVFVAAALASIAQPHLRYLVRENNKVNLFIGGFFFAILLIPLGWGVYNDPAVARDLLAVPANLPDPLQFLRDFTKAASNLFNPFNLSSGEVITPALTIVSVTLLIFGGIRLLRDFHSVRAYFLLIWAALLLPIIGFNPTHLAVLLIPSILVITIGLNQVIRYWYRLFPRNPYARLFALLPLGLLLFTIVQANYQRYIYAMLYSPQAGAVFQPDAFLAQKEITGASQSGTITVVVKDSDVPLYTVMAARRPGTVVISGQTALTQPATPGEWITQDSQSRFLTNLAHSPPSKLLVTDRQQDALRFSVYQR